MKRHRLLQGLILVIGFLLNIGGCAVPQPTGRGNQFLMQEPEGHRTYYLYLPAGFTPARHWPLVVTLHGMKPFDSAPAQAKEWQNIADQYGYVVVAPVLLNSDLFMEYPLTHVSHGVKEDEKRVLDILNDVIEHCNIDSKRVFATSWSSGGYLLHYLVNRYPDTFAAMCARGSCFNEEILDKENARKMAERNFPVMIYYGENDLVGIRKESQRGIKWYQDLGFNVTQAVVSGKGHERVPDLAGRFFAQSSGMKSGEQKLEIETGGSVGMAPFTVNLRAGIAGLNVEQYKDYKFTWYIDDKLQNLAKEPGKHMLFATLYVTGEHTVRVEVLTPDEKKLEAETKIRVLPAAPAAK